MRDAKIEVHVQDKAERSEWLTGECTDININISKYDYPNMK